MSSNMRLKSTLSAVLLLGGIFSSAHLAHAQGSCRAVGAMLICQPTETDLLAAYCTHVIGRQIESIKPLQSDAALSEKARAAISDLEGDLTRIRGYLAGRAPGIEPGPLMIAGAQGDRDVAQLGLALSGTVSAEQAKAIGDKVLRCRNAAFLPY